MNNADLPAMPLAKMIMSTDGSFSTETSPGLTKREHFAGLAMQGFIANSDKRMADQSFDVIAKTALLLADSLLEELEKTK